MQSFSREAALTLAQQQIQQKRIERIQAVRDREKKFAKQQSAQFSELQQCTQKEVKQELAQEWEQRKLKKLEHLKQKYQDLQSSIGLGHESASTSTQQLHESALENQAILGQEHTVQQQRAGQALSKLQQKLLAEKNDKSTRTKWRRSAVELALLHRRRLQKQLEHQYFTLPEGLSPTVNLSSSHCHPHHHALPLPPHTCATATQHNSSRHAQPQPTSSLSSDPPRYTLVTSHQNAFDPHPAVYLQQIADENKKYNLKQYLPRKLLKKLNKKYNKARKKNEKRMKQEKKFKAAGVQLKSDGTQMSSIPEDTTLSTESRLTNDSDVNLSLNPWQSAKQVRQTTADKQRKQTQQFLAAQKRGKTALQREKKKRRAQQLDNEFELMHQDFIKQKLAKCQQIMQQVNTKHQTRQQLQAELEQKFESFFQVHGSPPAGQVPKQVQVQGDFEQEMKPRMTAPEPVSYSSPSSSQSASRSCSPNQKTRAHTIDDDGKEDEAKNMRNHVHAPQRRERISVSIPSVPVAVAAAAPAPAIPTREQTDAKQTEDEDEDCDDGGDEDEDNVSVTRSRRVKIHYNDDGTAFVSQASSASSSALNSPQKQQQQELQQKSEVDNDRVFVPKQWFESLLQKISQQGESKNASQMSSSTISAQAVRLKDFGNGQVAMSRTWFEQLLHDIYAHEDGAQPHEHEQDEATYDDAILTRHDMLARGTATNSQQPSSDERSPLDSPVQQHQECSDASSTVEDTEGSDADDDNDGDDDDDDDEEDDDMKRNVARLRQSIDSDMSNAGRQSVSDVDVELSAINLENTEKFIRQSQALLDKTANFFENFSESESMDYSKTDQSLINKREDIDTLLRSSIQSDSSQWSLSSVSSADISKLSASLLPMASTADNDTETEPNGNDEQSPNALHMIKPKLLQTLKTPMQTIQELDSTLSQSEHSASDKNDAPNASTPCTPNVDVATSLNYHSDEEKASVTCSDEERTRETTTAQDVPKAPPLTTDHFKTPVNSTNDTKSSISTTGDGAHQKHLNPRFTDSTANTYPSLPSSNRGLDPSSQSTTETRSNNNDNGGGAGDAQNAGNVSALPIQHLNFRDIQISNLHSTTESNSDHDQSESDSECEDVDEDEDEDDDDDDVNEEDDSEAHKQALRELEQFNDEINEEFEQILSMKCDANGMALNMSGIDEVASNANDSIGEIMAKISNLSTSSFTLSTFQDEFQESGKTNDNLLNWDHFNVNHEEEQTKKFPPLTPQDLMGSDAEDEDECDGDEKDKNAQSNEAQSNHSSLLLFETDDDQQSTNSLQNAYQTFRKSRKQHTRMNEKLKKLKMRGKQKKSNNYK